MGYTTAIGSAVLAHSATLLAEAPAPIRGASGFEKWVLQSPLPLAVMLVAVGVIVFFSLRSQGRDRQAKITALALLIAAAAVYATGSLVTTDREKLQARSRELIDAVARVDTTRVDSMLARDAMAPSFGLDHDGIMSRMEQYLGGQYRIKSHSIPETRASIKGPNLALTQSHVRATVENSFYAAPVGSWWLLTWRKEAVTGEWKVIEIEMQQLDGVDNPSSLRP